LTPSDLHHDVSVCGGSLPFNASWYRQIKPTICSRVIRVVFEQWAIAGWPFVTPPWIVRCGSPANCDDAKGAFDPDAPVVGAGVFARDESPGIVEKRESIRESIAENNQNNPSGSADSHHDRRLAIVPQVPKFKRRHCEIRRVDPNKAVTVELR
jgi:hypothetical protein